jgi:DNA-binding beta-propeller fold protein YncE
VASAPKSYGGLRITAVVVNRATWTISATADLGQPTSGSIAVTDGTHIYVPTADVLYVAVVDAETNAVIGTIETLGSNSVALLDGVLWTASGRWDLVQRFDDV